MAAQVNRRASLTQRMGVVGVCVCWGMVGIKEGKKGREAKLNTKSFHSRLRPHHEEGLSPGKQLICLPQYSRAVATTKAYGFPGYRRVVEQVSRLWSSGCEQGGTRK